MANKIESDPGRREAGPLPSGFSTGRALPPKPASKPPPPKTANAEPEEDDGHGQDDRPPSVGMVSAMPAWAISMLFHIIALLAMALVAGEAVQTEIPTVITSGPSDVEEEFSEIEEEEAPETSQDTSDAVADVVVTEVAVTPVEVTSLADDVDAAALSVELNDFGSETAPASDMMSTIGAIGGTGGGLGGRANAGRLAAAGGGGADTEQAVDRALKWIANHQMPDGGWSFDVAKCPSCNGQCTHSGVGKADDRCAATAMALLPFLGRGYTHTEGPYKKQVEGGIGFLVKMAVAGKGQAYDGGGSLYSQGLAGIALSECYAMTQDSRLAVPTQAVLNFIMNAQDPHGGGWRYSPRQPGDTSAVGWQIMALKSGNMAYLQVNPLTVKKAVEFLDSVQSDSGATYGYTGPDNRPGTSAVGLLCRMYLGWKKDHPGLQDGAARLAKMGPNDDLYYDYYATQIMHHMEGDMWIAWNDKMKGMLLKLQADKDHETGSWYKGVDGGHGAHAAGRLYCTSLAAMILEVYYRHLPIYKNQSVAEEFRE
ncbi:MAG: terpene cyclase/mutase family protein [Planctomycetes bacterium]|nr:terpene cyclase/mutase family protein [Planctomycetota bacterium]